MRAHVGLGLSMERICVKDNRAVYSVENRKHLNYVIKDANYNHLSGRNFRSMSSPSLDLSIIPRLASIIAF